jgi:hypothetical protein
LGAVKTGGGNNFYTIIHKLVNRLAAHTPGNNNINIELTYIYGYLT